MTDETLRAATTLADLLARENAALEALDIPAAIGLLAAKRAATEALVRGRAALQGLPANDLPAARDVLTRLDGVAARNRDLLAQAIRVQGRVVALVAGAVPPRRTTYGGHAAATSVPIAVSLRA